MATEGPLTAAQIYEQITGGEGVGSLADAQDGARQLTTRMVERAQRINTLRAKTMSGWRGDAGEAAADATLPLVQAAADDAVHLQNAQSAVGAQMDAFGTAKYSVKPVSSQPPELGAEDVVRAISDHGWGSYHAKVARWQADSQANIDAFSAYHSASTSNGGQMPAQYAQLADSGASISMQTSGNKTGPTDTGEWARNPRDTQVPSQDRQTVRPGQNRVTDGNQRQTQQDRQPRPNQVQAGNTNTGTTISGTTHSGNTPSDATHANSYVPKPVLPAAQGGYEFGPTGQPVSNLTGTNWPGGFGPGSGPYSGGGYQPSPGMPGTSTGTGPGAGNKANQPGPRAPGSSTGARLPEERLPGANPLRGSAGPRGANGLPMGTPLAGRGGKEEDREKKKAPYLQNPDPDETFGGFTEKPMPPVIGEHKKR
ncbi:MULTISPECIES: PPE domain-containing protein [unclassified Amycolatopsis]|uniref:PPE domain-containing protein n=1 Tax=unclassified Amycolatopsis TaxID=2618356 RepID=UPI0028757DF0|nr:MULTISPECIES: PPE domain-containing protein [unclassified Amycolatopsis]MDS0132539.1 PPE domain-containing protein [Amycolatopsis sp. 505]MDS0142636.1 PPE domain-containing protein [Amycolatopsis sp. CM201R]